jgi:hypothetical protein
LRPTRARRALRFVGLVVFGAGVMYAVWIAFYVAAPLFGISRSG